MRNIISADNVEKIFSSWNIHKKFRHRTPDGVNTCHFIQITSLRAKNGTGKKT